MLTVREVPLPEIAALRDAYRAEQNCQIVHDAIHRRHGWSREFALLDDGAMVGYASIAVDGPWRERPTFYELYIVPEQRHRAFALFERLLSVAHPHGFEVQTSDTLSTALALAFAKDIGSERIVFRDDRTTSLVIAGATLRQVTAASEIRNAIEARQGGGEWRLEIDGVAVGSGGLLFHYNRPYCDLYMEIDEPYRRRGYGAYVVQELKRVSYELGATPAARCSTENGASRRTLQTAGMLPFAHILYGGFRATG